MTKFKKGDKFIPRMPNHYGIANLRNYWNCTYTVRAINNEWVIARENGLLFHVDWCEKAEECFPETNKTIDWEHFIITDKTIDWEQRRYEIAKYALQGMLSHSTRYKPRECDKNLHWHAAISKEATEIADELIKQLQKTE